MQWIYYFLQGLLTSELLGFYFTKYILSQEIRAYLIDILSKKVLFEDKYQRISTVINKFTLQCFDILDPDEDKKVGLNNFDIITSEGLKK